jgi:hypothetical protein
MTPNPRRPRITCDAGISAAGRNWSEVSANLRTRDRLHGAIEEAAAKTGHSSAKPRPRPGRGSITTFWATEDYQGTSRHHSQIPNNCADILSNRYGSAKDHSFC